MKILLITVMAVAATAKAEPAVLFSNGLLPPPFSSAALVAPAAAPVIAPVAPMPAYGPLTSYSAVAPVISDYRYAYSSSYNYQDYVPVVNSALSLPYSLPYAYSADWFYRK